MGKKIFISILVGGIITAVAVVFLLASIVRHNREARYEALKNAKAPEVSITTIEGWTVNDIGKYLQDQNLISSQNFIDAEKSFDVSSYNLLASKPSGSDLEGFLFPDTYLIFKPAAYNDPKTAGEIIQKMLDNFTNKFTEQMVTQSQRNGMSVYQTLILASIVEKETGSNADEKKTVAGIFYNRLSANMPLQSDATVNFATGKNTPSASSEDIKINSPYNTYIHTGLPPGPIGNPSLASIMAVLYPAKTNYFYFLDKPDGTPVYSITFQEQLANEQKYLK